MRQQVNSGERFRRGNAVLTLIVARHLAVLDGPPAVCLCLKGESSAASGDACLTAPGPYACHPVDALLTGPRGPEAPSAVLLAPLGQR